MSARFDELKQAATELLEDERAALALVLLESLEAPADDGDVEQAWRLEIERRAAEIERGEVQPVPGDIVLARLRRRLG
jgi:putative addiction module component (TIGR02574 family)